MYQKINEMNVFEKNLRENLGEVLTKMEKILNKAEDEEREMTPEETAGYLDLQKKYQGEEAKLKAFLNNQDSQEDENVMSSIIGSTLGNNGKTKPSNVETWERVDDGGKGEKIKVLSNKASLSRELGFNNTDGYNWRDYMKDRIAGFTAKPGFKNDVMSTTGDSSLVPAPLAGQVIDLARNKSVVFRARRSDCPNVK